MLIIKRNKKLIRIRHFFTADLHLDHKNIIKYCNRPFSSVKEMNAVILGNLESILKKNDRLYVLGDLSYSKKMAKKFFRMFSDVKIIYIYGNHDNKRIRNMVKKHAILFSDLINTKIDKKRLTLCHYPMKSWKMKPQGSWQIHGHSHGRCDEYPCQLDVGVDTNNFKPYSFCDIKRILDNQEQTNFECESNEERR